MALLGFLLVLNQYAGPRAGAAAREKPWASDPVATHRYFHAGSRNQLHLPHAPSAFALLRHPLAGQSQIHLLLLLLRSSVLHPKPQSHSPRIWPAIGSCTKGGPSLALW
ncbi:hypothetical protein PAHAL_4G122700 [Panicum hallii]|uniref:Uncharacterized protein n=1 Tax=Panicum hallii TaxID=206008 RepID=A0A2T8JCP8_9POAL|nr:hypothetical protein PAHAL_4G122700 [Panicum hallii]